MKKILAALLTLCMAFSLAACGTADKPEQSNVPTENSTAPAPSQETPSAEVAGTYTFTESAMGGQFTVDWTLTLNEDGTYVILEKNPFMGDLTYEGTYTVEDGVVVTGPFEGEPPKAEFFEADKSCRWTLDGDRCTPANYDSSDAPAAGGAEAGNLKGVAYASTSGAQVCDIYQPTGVEKAPVIVLVHGGGFMFGDQGMTILQPVIDAALANGYAVVSVDYRKSSEAVFPAALADVKAAVRFVRAHAAEYGFDPGHIAVWGESAGAYLSLMTALTPDAAQLNGDVTDYEGLPSGVSALVSFYAPVEFYTMYAEKDALNGTDAAAASAAASFESKFLGKDILADKAATDATYWETYADQLPSDLKVWIQAGSADQRVPYTQSENFAARLSGYLGEENVRFGLIEGADHEDDLFYTEDNLADVFAWLDGIMK